MGSIMWAASGLVGIMLPGVAVTFNPMFPELMAALPAPILFCGAAAGGFWRGEHAANSIAMTTHTGKTSILTVFSRLKGRSCVQVDYIGYI